MVIAKLVNVMNFDQLKVKALSLPYSPGVYLMKDKEDRVIYVGKAKKLKNRVSQYFQDTASHTPKTRLMVSKIDHFDVIVAASEFEALVLECSLIKRYMPKYNILLKDDKGYPYIRLDARVAYPSVTMVNKISDDGACYYGPYGSRGITQEIISTICTTLKLPSCTRSFPRDIGKGRPCLNYHMNLCEGWCREECRKLSYKDRVDQVRQLLSGNHRKVLEQIRKQMLEAADNMEFEIAAGLRDRLSAVEALGKKQLVSTGVFADMDVIGYYESTTRACFAVLHFSDGNLLDRDCEVIQIPDDREQAVSSLIKQYYLSRGVAPKVVLLPFFVSDSELFSQLLLQKYNIRTKFKVPQRGDNLQLVDLAIKNAAQEAERIDIKEEKFSATLIQLGKMLAIEPPKRIEAFDISNISGTDIVASMVVFQDCKAKKSEYKRFKIDGLENQDDYASMKQVVRRRFDHYLAGNEKFGQKPDLLLIDGGITHAQAVVDVLRDLELNIPVVGMVKDDRHRTRALVTPEGNQIGIDTNLAVYSLVGNIQEETHRFAITYHRKLRSKRMKYSELDMIPGIGQKRKAILIKAFKSIRAIKDAQLTDLEHYLPSNVAISVYNYFHSDSID